MTALKVTGVGDSIGVILPKELLLKLGVEKGDTLYAVETPDGVTLTTVDPDFETQLTEARRLMNQWRNVLRELAK